MNDKTALAIAGQQAEMDVMSLGNVLAKSGYFADAREAGQAVVKVLAGRELGFGPIASMTGIFIVKGRVTMSANLMAAAIKRSGRYNYRVLKLDDTECSIQFFEGKDILGVSTFTYADAKRAGLSSQTWSNFPRNMLFARAMSNGARWYTPDLFGGPTYTPDELGESVNEDGQVVEAVSVREVQTANAPVVAPQATGQAITPQQVQSNGSGQQRAPEATTASQKAMTDDEALALLAKDPKAYKKLPRPWPAPMTKAFILDAADYREKQPEKALKMGLVASFDDAWALLAESAKRNHREGGEWAVREVVFGMKHNEPMTGEQMWALTLWVSPVQDADGNLTPKMGQLTFDREAEALMTAIPF